MARSQAHKPKGKIARAERLALRLVVGLWIAWTLTWLVMVVSGEAWFLVDLGLAYQAQLTGCATLVLLWALVRRRWSVAGVLGVGVVLSFGSFAAGRGVMYGGVDLDAPPAERVVRVVTANIHPQNERWREDLERLFSYSPDIVVLIETPPELWRGIVRRGELDQTDWRYHERRAWVSDIASPCFVLSRWPMERLVFEDIEDADRDVLIARVDRPEGAFLVGAIHPHSPRNLERYRRGNRQIRGTYDAIDEALAVNAGPLVMGVDLNSGPAGWRAVQLRRAGLDMSKPLMGGGGSFPVGLPWLLRVQLDDVWRSEGVRVRAWSSVGELDSDHRAVVVDLMLDE